MFELTTARFVMRPLWRDDAERLHQLGTSPGVRRFLWDDETIPFERTLAVLETSGQWMSTHRYGLWGACVTATGRLTGVAGFWHFREPPELELLYALAEDAWGRGYATEMSEP